MLEGRDGAGADGQQESVVGERLPRRCARAARRRRSTRPVLPQFDTGAVGDLREGIAARAGTGEGLLHRQRPIPQLASGATSVTSTPSPASRRRRSNPSTAAIPPPQMTTRKPLIGGEPNGALRADAGNHQLRSAVLPDACPLVRCSLGWCGIPTNRRSRSSGAAWPRWRRCSPFDRSPATASPWRSWRPRRARLPAARRSGAVRARHRSSIRSQRDRPPAGRGAPRGRGDRWSRKSIA